MKKWYNFETLFGSLKDALCIYLKENGIYYEVSAFGFCAGWHFEIKASEEETKEINAWLDANTIYCEGVH